MIKDIRYFYLFV